GGRLASRKPRRRREEVDRLPRSPGGGARRPVPPGGQAREEAREDVEVARGAAQAGTVRQSRMCRAPALSPARMVLPSGVMAQEGRGTWGPSVARGWPVPRPHTFSVLSYEGETAKRPSDVTATPCTALVCPLRVRTACPVLRSHTFSVLSTEAET